MSRRTKPICATRTYAVRRTTARNYAPRGAWRPSPLALQLARELVAQPALLSLRTRRLVADLRTVRHVGGTVAREAVSMARRLRHGERYL